MKDKSLDVLLVDDSVLVRKIIAKTLSLLRINLRNIYEAAEGAGALEILRQHGADLVITDVNMPEMDGVAMVHAMANDEQLRKIPVIIVSSDGAYQRRAELEALGVETYLRKPFTPEAFRHAIEEVMKHES